jgi:hypothetical protein
LLVETIDRDPTDLGPSVRCGHSHQGAFVGAGSSPSRSHRQALGILVFNLDMQIGDRGSEGFDELVRPVEPARSRLGGSIVILVLGREEFIE